MDYDACISRPDEFDLLDDPLGRIRAPNNVVMRALDAYRFLQLGVFLLQLIAQGRHFVHRHV